jgi:hypothetical protein|tara:strand:- start:237 stop:443 length:207 start_codon:yes stop_codon:yes gene_type:complete
MLKQDGQIMLVYVEGDNLYPVAMSDRQKEILKEEILPKLCEGEEIRVIESKPYPRKALIKTTTLKELK